MKKSNKELVIRDKIFFKENLNQKEPVITKYYNNLSKDYDKIRFKTKYQKYINEKEIDFVKKNVAGTVLEIGAGTGRFTREIVNKCDKLISVDTSGNMLNKLKEIKNVELKKMDLFDIKKLGEYGKFDTIICMRLLPHIQKIDKALEILKNGIKKDGRVIFDMWNNFSFIFLKRVITRYKSNVFTKFMPYSKMEILIKKAGLEIEDSFAWGYPRLPCYPLEKLGKIKYFKPIGYSIIFKTKWLQ